MMTQIRNEVKIR